MLSLGFLEEVAGVKPGSLVMGLWTSPLVYPLV